MDAGQPFFDALLHVYDPRFTLRPNQHFTPGPFRPDDYRHQVSQLLGVAGFRPAGGAVVSPSFYGPDHEPLVDALAALGPRFVGVAQLGSDVTDDEIVRLDAAGVRATRLNLVRRVHVDEVESQLTLARRTRELVGWHLELYVRSTDLPGLLPRLPPADALVVDHLGLSAAGLSHLLQLARQGARIKATGFSRGDLDVLQALRALHQANPGSLVAGTDLPGTRSPQAITAADLVLLRRTFDPAALDRIVHRNAVALYRPAETTDPRDPSALPERV
jgi:predicted TIM-barrel fold metal-dependent hydrolase